MCLFSSIQNFFVNIFYYGNSVKISRQAFGNYEVNNKAGVGIKLEGLEKLKKKIIGGTIIRNPKVYKGFCIF